MLVVRSNLVASICLLSASSRCPGRSCSDPVSRCAQLPNDWNQSSRGMGHLGPFGPAGMTGYERSSWLTPALSVPIRSRILVMSQRRAVLPSPAPLKLPALIRRCRTPSMHEQGLCQPLTKNLEDLAIGLYDGGCFSLLVVSSVTYSYFSLDHFARKVCARSRVRSAKLCLWTSDVSERRSLFPRPHLVARPRPFQRTHPPLHFPFRLLAAHPHVGSGAREPDCRAHAPARCSHPPWQFTPYPAGQAPSWAGSAPRSRPFSLSSFLPLLSRADRATSKEGAECFMGIKR